MLACDSEIDVSSYLQLDGLQECGVNMEWHGELELSDCEERLEGGILEHVIRTPEDRHIGRSNDYYNGIHHQEQVDYGHSYSSSSSIDSFNCCGDNREFSWCKDQQQQEQNQQRHFSRGTDNSGATTATTATTAGDEKYFGRLLPAQMINMVHTQPVHLIHVHNLKALQTSFEDEEAAANVAALEAAAEAAEAAIIERSAAANASSTPPSLADTRNNSVFSSTRSINNLLQDQQDMENDIKLMPPTKKRSLVAPIMFHAGKSQVTANTNNTHNKIKHHNEPQKLKPNCKNTTKPVSEKDQFVYTLTNKLLPYFGYFLADSNDLEYFDKVRFQEIDYKFSKTYF